MGCWRLLLWVGLGTRRRGGIGREGMGIDGIFKYLKYKNIRPIQHRFELLSHPQQKGNHSIPPKSTDNSHMNQSAVVFTKIARGSASVATKELFIILTELLEIRHERKQPHLKTIIARSSRGPPQAQRHGVTSPQMRVPRQQS